MFNFVAIFMMTKHYDTAMMMMMMIMIDRDDGDVNIMMIFDYMSNSEFIVLRCSSLETVQCNWIEIDVTHYHYYYLFVNEDYKQLV